MADFLGLMKQATELKSKMEAMQAELDQIEVEGISGGGLVTVKLSAKGELKGVLGYETRPLVSVDFIGNPLSSIVDAAQTQVIGEDLLQVQSWYDNEWGFSNRMVDLLHHVAR